MSKLEEALDEKEFFRINRGEIVNVNYIIKMEGYFGNRLAIQIQGEQEKLKTRTSSSESRQALSKPLLGETKV